MRGNGGRRRRRAYPALDGGDGNQLGGMWKDKLDGWTLTGLDFRGFVRIVAGNGGLFKMQRQMKEGRDE